MDRYLGARRGLRIATMPLRRISRSEIRGFGNQDINEIVVRQGGDQWVNIERFVKVY